MLDSINLNVLTKTFETIIWTGSLLWEIAQTYVSIFSSLLYYNMGPKNRFHEPIFVSPV